MAGEKVFLTAPGVGFQISRVFRPPGGIAVQIARSVRGVDVELEEADFRSLLGTPVFTQIEFQPGRYFELSDIEKENPIDYEGVVLQTVLADVTQTKNIVTTPIQGRNGTVKEFVSDGDFIITITGGVIGETVDGKITEINQFYPEVDVRRLIEICKVPQAVTITAEFLQLFGINDVVITDYNFGEKEGTRDLQPFQITMLSDIPIDLNELSSPRIIQQEVRIAGEPVIIVA